MVWLYCSDNQREAGTFFPFPRLETTCACHAGQGDEETIVFIYLV
jgi:hypothetical protein